MIVSHGHNLVGQAFTEGTYTRNGRPHRCRIFGWLTAEEVENVLSVLRRAHSRLLRPKGEDGPVPLTLVTTDDGC